MQVNFKEVSGDSVCIHYHTIISLPHGLFYVYLQDVTFGRHCIENYSLDMSLSVIQVSNVAHFLMWCIAS